MGAVDLRREGVEQDGTPALRNWKVSPAYATT